MLTLDENPWFVDPAYANTIELVGDCLRLELKITQNNLQLINIMEIHLNSIEIPNFSVIKNLNLTFESERIPRIYPVGGANGSGKSTMLQLTYLLLHGTYRPHFHQYIQNMLGNCEVDRTLLSSIISIDGSQLSLTFYTKKRFDILEDDFHIFQQKFARLQLFPIYYCESKNYILWVKLEWLNNEDETCITLDASTIPMLLQEISDRVFFASHAAQGLFFLRSTFDYYRQVEILAADSNYMNLDRCQDAPNFENSIGKIQEFQLLHQDSAIFLLDNPDLGLHPDKQYQVVGDLQKWNGESQYIIATHSYELCTALTPAHVKEI